MKKEVLGVKIDDISIDQAVQTVIGWLDKEDKHYIVTPNPEIVVMAQKDKEFKNIINDADLAIPDGAGLRLATDIVCNTPGIDLMEELIKTSLDYGFTIGLLGGRNEVAKKAAECLLREYPKLKVVFAQSGGEVDNEGKLLKLPKCDLLFVAFGPSKQEKWIARNLSELPVRVAMGVGGSFDYLSGTIPRAPKFMRKLGLEWLFRLIVQPWRIKRQLALVKYLFLMLRGKVSDQ